MPKRKHTAEEIINKLREAEVMVASGGTVVEAVRRIGVSEQTFYRWRAEYAGLRVDQARRLKQLETENSRIKRAVAELTLDHQILPDTRQPDTQGSRGGKLPSPARRRLSVEHVRSVLGVSERRACRVLDQPRSTQRHEPLVPDDEQALTNDIVGLATRFGRYGYRRITALLRGAGWQVNHKRVERIWRREGLKVPARQPRRGRPWLNDGCTVRLRPERRNHVWAYDLVHIRTRDGRPLRLLTAAPVNRH